MQNKTRVLRVSPLYPGMMVDPGKYVTVFHIGKHEFSWAVLPQRGHGLQSHVPIAAYLFNSPLHGTPQPTSSTGLMMQVAYLTFMVHWYSALRRRGSRNSTSPAVCVVR
jgi:hypothetical protein